MRFLTPDTPVQLAIADGATTPDPGVTGAMAWSTTTGTFVRWSGSAWSAVTVPANAVTPAKLSATARTGVNLALAWSCF
jgi:hypothetical protein